MQSVCQTKPQFVFFRSDNKQSRLTSHYGNTSKTVIRIFLPAKFVHFAIFLLLCSYQK